MAGLFRRRAKGGQEYKNVIKTQGVDDMVLLTKVDESSIVDNLKKRFNHDVIYTYIGHVLIAVNPFHPMNIYGPEIVKDYIHKTRVEMPPHVYATSEETYRAMVNDKENQCIIISGESGAGKTESAKLVMKYIAAITKAGKNSHVDKIKDIILETNPLLEAFGNAKTLRNNNSSRFGKYFEIQFNRGGMPDGGYITNYLLEKSRIVYQIAGERNFHIFYNLVKGANDEMRNAFQLFECESYYYLAQSGCVEVPGMDDVADFKDVLHAMEVIGITKEEQWSIFQTVAGVLWLGNIQFQEEGDRAYPVDGRILDFAASLLEVDNEMLSNCLSTRMMQTGRGGRVGTTYQVPLNAVQAAGTRDALARAIYDRLFSWLVVRINQAMKKEEEGLVIGVLDIYGFEVFDNNGFEQFCINYVNEKLQQIFIELTLKQEQEEYKEEGIQWKPIKYFNNKIVCDLIDARRPPGMLAVMDDVCATVHAESDAADATLQQKLDGMFGQHQHYVPGGAGFCIHHYAGDVMYSVDGMTDKNKDTMYRDILQTIQSSSNRFMAGLFPEVISEHDKKRPTTSGFKIRDATNTLVAKLMASRPHYIRTIKPNDSKKAHDWESNRVQHQARYLGLVENIRVRRAGFAYRQIFQKFLENYCILVKDMHYAGKLNFRGDPASGCVRLLQSLNIADTEYQLGHSKIFIAKPETLFSLEEMRERFYNEMASKIQRAYRKFDNEKYFFDLRARAQDLLAQRKERQRLSIICHFAGDYLNMRTQYALLKALGDQFEDEQLIFADRGNVLIHRRIRGNKLDPRTFILTSEALYIIKFVSITKQDPVSKASIQSIEPVVDRRIPINYLKRVSMSPYADNYCVIHLPPAEHPDIVAELERKTELVASIWDKNTQQFQLNVSPSINYWKKQGDKNQALLEFAQNPAIGEGSVLKRSKVEVGQGLPATTPIKTKQIRMQKTAKVAYGATGGQFTQVQPSFGQNDVAYSAGPAGGGEADDVTMIEALFAYDAQNDEELTLCEGDTFELVAEDADGWWEGRKNGKVGFFPGNYVKKLPPKPKKKAPPPAPKPKPAPKPSFQPPAQQPKPSFQPPVQQPKPSFQPPAQQPKPSFQPPVQQPKPSFQPPVQQPKPSFQPPVQQPKPSFQQPSYQNPAPAVNRAPAKPMGGPPKKGLPGPPKKAIPSAPGPARPAAPAAYQPPPQQAADDDDWDDGLQEQPAKPAYGGGGMNPMAAMFAQQQAAGSDRGACGECGCGDFVPHPFKRNQCANCFHQH